MGLAVIATTGYAYWRKRNGSDGKSICAASAAKGAALAGLSATIFAVLGLPVLVELMIALAATQLARKHVFENHALRLVLIRSFQQSREGADALLARVIVAARKSDAQPAAERAVVAFVVDSTLPEPS